MALVNVRPSSNDRRRPPRLRRPSRRASWSYPTSLSARVTVPVVLAAFGRGRPQLRQIYRAESGQDVAARHLWCVGTGRHRTLLSARHGYLYRPSADDHRLDAALANSLLKFSQNGAEQVAAGVSLPACVCRKRQTVAYPEEEIADQGPQARRVIPASRVRISGPGCHPGCRPEGAGCAGDADFPVDPLRISPERRIPTSTGNSFFRISELTPENFCA